MFDIIARNINNCYVMYEQAFVKPSLMAVITFMNCMYARIHAATVSDPDRKSTGMQITLMCSSRVDP